MKTVIVTAVLPLLTLLSAPAAAGPYSDAMSRCLVDGSSAADRATLVQWMFATAALHPDVKTLATATQADRDRLNRQVGALVERLVTETCVKESRDAVGFEGPASLEASFNALGQVAGRELFTSPAVAVGMTEFSKHVNQQKIRDALVK